MKGQVGGRPHRWRREVLPGHAATGFLPSLGHSPAFLGSGACVSCTRSPSFQLLPPLPCPHTPFFSKRALRTESPTLSRGRRTSLLKDLPASAAHSRLGPLPAPEQGPRGPAFVPGRSACPNPPLPHLSCVFTTLSPYLRRYPLQYPLHLFSPSLPSTASSGIPASDTPALNLVTLLLVGCVFAVCAAQAHLNIVSRCTSPMSLQYLLN